MASVEPFVIGTRGSALALAQADLTRKALEEAHGFSITPETRIVKTSGDLSPDLPLNDFSKGANPILDKGIFTKELEEALLAGEVDCAVHSAKDVPTVLPEGFELVAYLPREPIEDVILIPKNETMRLSGFEGLKPGSVVGTGSVRRVRQIAHLFPHLETKAIRGNVPTRVRKLNDPAEGLDAVILARAGLRRLGEAPGSGFIMLDDCEASSCVLSAEDFLPACGQGAVAFEIRSDNDRARRILSAINDEECELRVATERRFLHLLEAGCQTPVGAFTRLEKGTIHMKVAVYSEDAPDAPPREAKGSTLLANHLELAEELYESVR